jgi:hypothetical protein
MAYPALPSLAAIAMATFLLGQKISDMIQLAVADLKSPDEPPAQNSISQTQPKGTAQNSTVRTDGTAQPSKNFTAQKQQHSPEGTAQPKHRTALEQGC